MVANTISQAHVTYVTLKIALNVQDNVSNIPCLYLFACWHRFMYFFLQSLALLSIHLINALSFNCYVHYQMVNKLLSICVAVVDNTCIKSVREFRKFIRLK